MIFEPVKLSGTMAYRIFDKNGVLKIQGKTHNTVTGAALGTFVARLAILSGAALTSTCSYWFGGLMHGEGFTGTSAYDSFDTLVSTHPGWTSISSQTLITTLRPQWIRNQSSAGIVTGSTMSWTSIATNVNFSVAGAYVFTHSSTPPPVYNNQRAKFPGFLYAAAAFTDIVTVTPGDTLEVDYSTQLSNA